MTQDSLRFTIVHGCILPLDLYYQVDRHIWARPEGDNLVTLGYSDVAQAVAGRILHVTFRPCGRHYDHNATVAVLESAKWLGPFRTPIAGVLVETNDTLLADPELVNRSPYRRGWIVRLRADDLARDLATLLMGPAAISAYEAFIIAQGLAECIHCEGYELP